ncbi:retinol dehydrogenase 13-like [Lineus longissimus]|uniref:retinol dehydrogenase 13-like n=1 Tax=Lineus longissimus TaxID=88925 RepID=UPI002B4EF701
MSGRVVIITGANSGIGYKTAEYLCEAGDNVYLACRNEERGKAAVDKIKAKNPQALAHYLPLDLSNKESIEQFVVKFHEEGKKIQVLINNAAVALSMKDPKRQLTNEGMELMMGTNFIGHFYLTHLLLDDLKKTGEETGNVRVLNVTTALHDGSQSKGRQFKDVDMDDLFLVNSGAYCGGQAYKNSKAALIMFTYELARLLEGTGVSVNCVCPGFVPKTQLYRQNSAPKRFFDRYVMGGMLKFLNTTTSVDKAANIMFNFADDEKYKGVTGKYYCDNREADSSAETKDEEKQKKLWQLAGGYLKIEGYEPLEIPEPPPEPEPVPEKKEEEKPAESKEGDGEKKEEDGKEEKKDEEKKDETEKTEEKEPEDKEEKKE